MEDFLPWDPAWVNEVEVEGEVEKYDFDAGGEPNVVGEVTGIAAFEFNGMGMLQGKKDRREERSVSAGLQS